MYFWWHWAHKLSVTLQFMALPRNWRLSSLFDWQIQHSCGFWQCQMFFFLLWLHNLREFCMSKHSCSYVIKVPWNNIQKRLLLSFFFEHRRLWRVCTFAQAHLGLHHSTKLSCAGSNCYLCTGYKNNECCGEDTPAIMAHLGNHQCVCINALKMLPVRCN